MVIDEDEIDGIEDTYSGLAGNADAENTAAKDNLFSAIRSTLRRLTNHRDADGKDYYYDCIEILSVQDYLNKLKLMTWAPPGGILRVESLFPPGLWSYVTDVPKSALFLPLLWPHFDHKKVKNAV